MPLYAFGATFLTNGDAESACGTGFSCNPGWTQDVAEFHGGTHAFKYDNTTSPHTGTLRHATTVTTGFRMVVLRFWRKTSADYNGTINFSGFLHNTAGPNSEGAASNIIGNQYTGAYATWHQITTPPVYLMSAHDGETWDVRFTPTSTVGTGSVWLDDIELLVFDIPVQVAVLERWWGYVATGTNQTVTVQIDVAGTAARTPLQNAIATYELYLEIVNKSSPGTIYLSKIISVAHGSQTTTFDFSAIPLSTNLLLRSTLRTAGGGATAKLSDGTTTVVIPDWGLQRVPDSFFATIPSYIYSNPGHPAHGAAMFRGHLEYPWCLYSYYQAGYAPSSIPHVNQSNYEDLRVPGRFATHGIGVGAPKALGSSGTVNEFATIGVNCLHEYVYGSSANPGINTGTGLEDASVDQLTPWRNAMKHQGVHYSWHTREAFHSRTAPNTISTTNVIATSTAHGAKKGEFIKLTSGPQNGASVEVAVVLDANTFVLRTAFAADQSAQTFTVWEGSPNDQPAWVAPTASDSALWTIMGKRHFDKMGQCCWYMLDEPKDHELTNCSAQYRGLRDNGTAIGGIAWGAAGPHGPEVLDPRFRYCTDAIGTDEYPQVGSTSNDPQNAHFQTHATPYFKTPLTWLAAEESRIYAAAGGQRPHWVINQAFNFVSGGMPVYAQMLTQAVQGLITGAKGQMWWQLGNIRGMTNYTGGVGSGTTSATMDGAVSTVSGNLTSVTADIEERFPAGSLVNINTTPTPVAILGLIQGGVTTATHQVNTWTLNSAGQLTLVGTALNATDGTLTPDGAFTMNFSSPPAAGTVVIAVRRTTDTTWSDFVALTRKIMALKSVWVTTRNNALVTSVVETAARTSLSSPTYNAIQSAAWQHPNDPRATVIGICNLLNSVSNTVTVTLASAAEAGAVAKPWARSSSQADQSTIALSAGQTVFTDTFAANECALYGVQHPSKRLPTDGVVSKAGLAALP